MSFGDVLDERAELQELDRAALERNLRSDVASLTQELDASRRLAGQVGHEFNNILSVIMGYAELMVSGMPAGAPMRADLEEIRIAAERAVELTERLMAFSRRQGGQ